MTTPLQLVLEPVDFKSLTYVCGTRYKYGRALLFFGNDGEVYSVYQDCRNVGKVWPAAVVYRGGLHHWRGVSDSDKNLGIKVSFEGVMQ